MDTSRFNDARDETLIKRRPWYVLAVALLILSAITRQPIAFLAAVFALVMGIVPELWYRYALRNLVIHQRVSQKRAFFGETVTLSISVENQKLLPLPWLEVEDEIPIHLLLLTGRALPTYKVNWVALFNTFSLWSFQRVTRHYRLGCNARGVFSIGPAVLRSGDPLGWLLREERVPARESLLVYPLVAPIESFGLPLPDLFSRGLAQGSCLFEAPATERWASKIAFPTAMECTEHSTGNSCHRSLGIPGSDPHRCLAGGTSQFATMEQAE